jgi:peroxiredoxin
MEDRMSSRHAIAALLFLLCGIALAGPDGGPRGAAPGAGASAAPEDIHPADFTLPAPDGRPVELKQFLGKKPVLLVFWATWCPNCIEAIPALNALHAGPLAGKMQVLGLNYLETRKKVASAAKANNILYPVLLDESGKAARAYGIVGIPTYVLIDRTGKIVYRENVLPEDISRYL